MAHNHRCNIMNRSCDVNLINHCSANRKQTGCALCGPLRTSDPTSVSGDRSSCQE